MNARRILSGSRNPVDSATSSIASLDDCTRSRAASMRSRSIALDGVEPVSAARRAQMPCAHAGAIGEVLHVSGASRFSRAQDSSGPKRPFGVFSSSSEENCDWPPLRR